MCRPLLPFEHEAGEFEAVDVDSRRADVACHDCRLSRNGRRLNVSHRLYCMDRAWGAAATHDDVYSAMAPLVQRSLLEPRGSATVLCYGQTGTGKTYTLQGMISKVAEDLPAGAKVELTFVEIHGAKVFDLLAGRALVHLRQAGDGRVHVRGTTRAVASGGHGLLTVCSGALALRASEATERNHASSRSHAVCTITMLSGDDETGSDFNDGKAAAIDGCASGCVSDASAEGTSAPTSLAEAMAQGAESAVPHAASGAPSTSSSSDTQPRRICLRLVDLAGSERNYETTRMSAAQHRESSDINKALMALKDCFRAHAAGVSPAAEGRPPPRVPFRQHRLTQLLKDCFLEAAHRTLIVATASPSPTDLIHTINTLDHVALMAAPLELLVDTTRCELVLGAGDGDDDPLEAFNAVPVQRWDEEMAARWVATIEDGRYQDIVLPKGTRGVDLLRLSAQRLSGLWVGGVRHGGGEGEGPAWTVDTADDEEAAGAEERRDHRDVGRALFAALRKQMRRGAAAEAKRRWAKANRKVDVERVVSLAREAAAPSVERTTGGRQVNFWCDGHCDEAADEVAEQAQNLLLNDNQ